jgi:hypothetical protein
VKNPANGSMAFSVLEYKKSTAQVFIICVVRNSVNES